MRFGVVLVAAVALAGCSTVRGAGTIAAQQTKLPPAPPSLTQNCRPPARIVKDGDDLRPLLDDWITFAGCNADQVAGWRAYYAGLRGG